MSTDTEALPPLPQPFMRLYGQEERAAWCRQMQDYARLALAQRQQVPTHAETAAVLGINAALHRIEDGRPADAKAPLEAASAALTAATQAAEPELPKARSLTDELMDCVDRLGSEAKDVDPRVWDHLRVYMPAPQAAEPVAWGIFDSQGFYEAALDEASARKFCAHYNKREADPLKPYSAAPLYTAPQAAQAQPQGELCIVKNEAGQIVAVSRCDTDGRVLEIIAESAQPQEPPRSAPLSFDQLQSVMSRHFGGRELSDDEADSAEAFARAIERAHDITARAATGEKT